MTPVKCSTRRPLGHYFLLTSYVAFSLHKSGIVVLSPEMVLNRIKGLNSVALVEQHHFQAGVIGA
jgi:hypothetical protein